MYIQLLNVMIWDAECFPFEQCVLQKCGSQLLWRPWSGYLFPTKKKKAPKSAVDKAPRSHCRYLVLNIEVMWRISPHKTYILINIHFIVMVYHLLPISPLFHKIILLPLRNKKPKTVWIKAPQIICKVSSPRNCFGSTLVSHFLLTFYSLLYLITINIYTA